MDSQKSPCPDCLEETVEAYEPVLYIAIRLSLCPVKERSLRLEDYFLLGLGMIQVNSKSSLKGFLN